MGKNAASHSPQFAPMQALSPSPAARHARLGAPGRLLGGHSTPVTGRPGSGPRATAPAGRPKPQPRCPVDATAAAAAAAQAPPPSDLQLVVLTREAGKNGKLASALAAKGYATLEMPLVRSGPAADTAALPAALSGGGPWAWVVVTSPEAAAVFLAAWRAAGRPPLRVAAVGAGTARILDEAPGDDAPAVAFTPSLANAVTLAAELPAPPPGEPGAVLYPASAKAGTDLQAGLESRGCFAVTRLNTYDTLPVEVGELGEVDLARARAAAVVALASPSAVRAWIAAVGGVGPAASGPAVAAIGATTGLAAQKQGLDRVHWPEAPGLDGFVEACVDAAASQQQKAG
jgi:uroporphyrinogen-III synthase